MKSVLIIMSAVSAFIASAAVVENFNRGWIYNGRPVDLPHDAMFEMPWDAEARHGQQVFKNAPEKMEYTRTFNYKPEWEGKRVFLEFDGLMFYGDVKVNGKLVGSSSYGYLGFACDITSALRKDAPNLVEVWAKVNTRRDTCRWYTGGGLNRSVQLVVRPTKSISRHGIYVTTRENRWVDVEVMLDGFTTNREDWTAELLIRRDKEIRTSVAIPKGDKRKRVHFRFPAVELKDAALWSVSEPNLYEAEVRLVKDGKIQDAESVRFGVRTIEYSKNFGFKLNGEKVFLKGISGHTDMGALGNAAFKDAIERQLRTLKAFGFNCVRCSHNPYSREFYDLADELGLLVVDEITDKWKGCWAGPTPYLDQWTQLLTEWVLRDRNHPSIIMWSLGNELQQSEGCLGYQFDDWGVTTYRMMDVLVKHWDATRPTTVAMFPARANAVRWREPEFKTPPFMPPELACATEIASFNYQFEQYAAYREQKPDLIFFQSEASTSRWLAPYFGMDIARDVGCSYWGVVEYWGESNAYPKKGWNFSFFNHTMLPYPQAYLICGGFNHPKPFCHIGIAEKDERIVWNDIKSGQLRLGENWNRSLSEKSDIYVFSNAEQVELFVNGRSVGKRAPAKTGDATFVAVYQAVPWEAGELSARDSNGAEYAIKSTGPMAKLRVRKDFNGEELDYYWIEAVDTNGALVTDAKCRVLVEVKGEAKLIALDDGDHYTDESFAVSEKTMRGGRLLAIVRKSQPNSQYDIVANPIR